MGSPINIRALLAWAYDVALAAAGWLIAFWLRFDFHVPAEQWAVLGQCLPVVVAVYGAVFWAMGQHRGIWRYAGVLELRRIVIAVSLGGVAVALVLMWQRVGAAVSGSVFLTAPLLLLLFVSGSRLAYRSWKERRASSSEPPAEATPVLVVGAGEAAARLLKDLEESAEWRVVGLLDDDPAKRGRTVRGVGVLGSTAEVGEQARRFGVKQVVIAMPGVEHRVRRRVVDLCSRHDLRAMTVPAHEDIVSGRIGISNLRDVELDDLLGRDPVHLDDAGLAQLLGGRTVLVTGAGGSIGSELCRQIARYRPGRLAALDSSELGLYTIAQEFADRGAGSALATTIGDASNSPLLSRILAQYGPQIVFHAAAYKQVPMMEGENAFQGVANNVLATLAVARAAQASGCEKFVLVSSDKAVNPTSIMGASKRLAEMLCRELQPMARTRFVVVRFGNVLGSSGSVVPRFRDQILRGGPVTVTHPEMQRYFMSIPEAAQLVLQAALMGKGGEIFVLDMGEPVRIVDLARQMIRLCGATEEEIGIVYTGLRPGEKLSEELLADTEDSLSTPHPKLRVAKAVDGNTARLVEEVTTWLNTADDRRPEAVRARLQKWIPEYKPADPARLA